MSFGLDADFSFDKIKQIGDIALGDTQKMQSLSLAFSQATSTGKLMGQDLLQMINAGFNPLETISQRTGKSMKELKEEMAKGAISADMLSQAFEWATDEQGRFYQGAEKAGQTLAGKMGKMKDSISELAISVYSAIEPMIKPLIDFTTTIFEYVGKGLNWFVEKLREGNPVIIGITSAIGFITAALVVYNTVVSITKAAQKGLTLAVWKSNIAFLSSPVFWIVAGIIALIAVIVFLAVKIKGWGTLWDATIGFCKNITMTFVETIKLYFMGLVNAIAIPLDQIKKKWYEFKNAVGIGDEKENNAAINAINKDIDGRIDKMAQSAKNIKKYAQAAKDSFKGVKLEWDDSKSIKNVAQDLKKQLGITDNSAVTNNDFSNDLSNKSESISAGGKSVKNFNITIGSLIEKVDNNFNNSSDDPETATDFTTKLSDTLQMVLNDINYAAN
jgi:tape measure domain-containing protein